MVLPTLMGELLWYGGDLSSAGVNNTELSGGRGFGAAVLDDFVVPEGAVWRVTELFSHNLATLPMEEHPITGAMWTLRTGVTPSNLGNVLFAGPSAATVTPTGRDVFGSIEYRVSVTGLSLELGPGAYWMHVSPISDLEVYATGLGPIGASVGPSGEAGPMQIRRFQDGSEVREVVRVFDDRLAASLGVIGEPLAAIPEVGAGLLTSAGLLLLALGAGRGV